MFIRKAANGNYYLCKRSYFAGKAHGLGRAGVETGFKNWFFADNQGMINVNKITIPTALFGKKLRFKLEVEKK